MNKLEFKEGQTYICIKANGSWFTEGKEYKVFLNRYNRPMIIDDENDPCYSHYVDKGDDYQFKLKKEQPKVTLDEPQKPVVPKFVAEWFEENKDDLEFPIWELCVDSYGSKDEHGMLNWIQQSENNPIETLIRMKDGYEVEKEPLYYVRLPYEVWDEEAAELKPEYLYLHYEITSDETRMFPTKEPRKGFVAKLDELTIKSADERYWAFAVPVEEVAEG
ncbi:TPA: DUF1642 domain-containing protein [Enterococcus faecium]